MQRSQGYLTDCCKRQRVYRSSGCPFSLWRVRGKANNSSRAFSTLFVCLPVLIVAGRAMSDGRVTFARVSVCLFLPLNLKPWHMCAAGEGAGVENFGAKICKHKERVAHLFSFVRAFSTLKMFAVNPEFPRSHWILCASLGEKIKTPQLCWACSLKINSKNAFAFPKRRTQT